MRGNGAQVQREMLEQEMLNNAAMQGLDGQEESPHHLEEMLKNDVDGDLVDIFKPLLSRARQLTNLKEEEVWEAKHLNLNHFEFAKLMFPRSESIWADQDMREVVFGDSRSPLSPQALHELRALRDMAFSEVAMGRGGFLTKQITEQTRRSIVEGEDAEERSRSLAQKLFG